MASTNKYIKSPMNYTGGKGRLLSQILPKFPDNISTFVDLFCGGCNVGINVEAPRIIFNDNISYLIDLYQSFKSMSEETILEHVYRRIEEFNLSRINEEGYKSIRQLYNRERQPLDLFVLMAYGFNHQIRFNSAHEYNIPFGRERSSYNPNMEKNLRNFISKLHSREVVFSCRNFEDVDLSELGENDFVYCDPPYLISTGTYNDGKRGFTGWNIDEEMKLLTLLDHLNARNIRFALSNVLVHKGKRNSLLIDWILKNRHHVLHINKDYANSSYHTINRDKSSTDEVLITNYTTD